MVFRWKYFEFLTDVSVWSAVVVPISFSFRNGIMQQKAIAAFLFFEWNGFCELFVRFALGLIVNLACKRTRIPLDSYIDFCETERKKKKFPIAFLQISYGFRNLFWFKQKPYFNFRRFRLKMCISINGMHSFFHRYKYANKVTNERKIKPRRDNEYQICGVCQECSQCSSPCRFN